MMKEQFKVFSPLTDKSVSDFITKSDEGSDRILLEGIASTTSRDLHDEIVSSSAIESMAEQANVLNIHGDHWYNLEDVVGAIKESTVEDKQLKIKFLVTKKHTPYIKDLLETGVRLGLSIGGYVTSYDEKNRIINAIELHEISLTAMPANWDTFGTVTNASKNLVESNCLAGACYEIVKNLDNKVKTMTTKEIKTKEESSDEGLSKDDVIVLINEYMAEKEETIAQEITEKVESQLEAIVDSKLEELKDDESSQEDGEDEEVDETKATTDEEDETVDETAEEDEEEEEDKSKSFSPDMISEAINKGIADALGDNFAEKVAEKMFGKVDQNRSTKGSKYEQFMKTKQEESEDSTEEPVEKTTYSTKEAAEMLLAKQRKSNPIMAAAMNNLK